MTLSLAAAETLQPSFTGPGLDDPTSVRDVDAPCVGRRLEVCRVQQRISAADILTIDHELILLCAHFSRHGDHAASPNRGVDLDPQLLVRMSRAPLLI